MITITVLVDMNGDSCLKLFLKKKHLSIHLATCNKHLEGALLWECTKLKKKKQSHHSLSCQILKHISNFPECISVF